MTYVSLDAWWWPFVFILFAGWLATDIWRFAGVLLGRKLSDTSDAFILVRSVATALVAAVIARLILFPSGALGETTLLLRVGAAAIGFLAFMAGGQRIGVGVGVSLVVLLGGMAAGY
ncbi:AzlD domain-containing protein [Oricola cellulosilytica]|uniref:AzlD domain-containing protein n=1 Tax=Oricola cellulosilytica TaxID=1429082 RepID=A0A4R0PAE6_9HYPH|nr:AzlD domain-containing protein [Oricola cellulosilytica]TCD13222.1 AzlD domain-containing protein [Oricola cellulosilytica]